MALIYIGIGSNIEPERHVPLGIQALEAEFSALRLSAVYESAAVGFCGANFYNLVAEAHTERSVEQVVAGPGLAAGQLRMQACSLRLCLGLVHILLAQCNLFFQLLQLLLALQQI